MESDEIGGYVLLAGYGLMFFGAIRLFGLRRVLTVTLGIVLLAVAVAFGTLRGLSSRGHVGE